MTIAELHALHEQDIATAAYRAQLVTRYFSATDPFEQLRLYAEAVRYDRRHPDEEPIADELYGADLAEVS